MTQTHTTWAPAVNDFPAATGRTVTEGHAKLCRKLGHSRNVVEGCDPDLCPRCGEVVVPAQLTRPTEAVSPLAELTSVEVTVGLRRSDAHELLHALLGEAVWSAKRVELVQTLAPLVYSDADLIAYAIAKAAEL